MRVNAGMSTLVLILVQLQSLRHVSAIGNCVYIFLPFISFF